MTYSYNCGPFVCAKACKRFENACSEERTGKFFENLTIYINGPFKTPCMLQFDVLNRMRRQKNQKGKTAPKCMLPLESRVRHRSKINALEPSSDCTGLRQLTMDAVLIS
ncbi:hypothetical protein I79_001921 [Cricetulus griseus]|uniref:Uncharacterized protein n=1 Tax=Cricetulus griseus TaxID=10029 RepID=G3GW12_CRIGR|nr:hypothetical protein I79_001921 [Cricetulus griseus]